MTIAAFLASLPSDRAEAIAQIEGALAADGQGHRLSPEDRAALVEARLRRMK